MFDEATGAAFPDGDAVSRGKAQHCVPYRLTVARHVLRNDDDFGVGGGTAALSFGRATAVARKPTFAGKLQARFPDFELVPDLGSQLFGLAWWRGAATCIALIAASWALSPRLLEPIYGAVPLPMQGADLDETRALGVTPLAQGATSGRHMAATALVGALSDTPDRPIVRLSASIVPGSGFASALQHSGVSKEEAARVAQLVGTAVPLEDLKPGAQADLTLGRRAAKSQPRPLEKLSFRARFDAAIDVVRIGGTLIVRKILIAIDNTPMRIDGEVDDSLYRSARALGAPARAVEEFLKTIATRMPVSRLRPTSRFRLVVEQARAATGEAQFGRLLVAEIDQGGKSLTLMRWGAGDSARWFDANGTGERQGIMSSPLPGARETSGFGMRMHPILGEPRFHEGIDFAAPFGSPVHAALDGIVATAGRNGGYGNFVKLMHAGGMSTGYGHMSRILVRPGQHVRRGETIGLEGSTGLSTGPHLHFETRRNGIAFNPARVAFSTVERLTGADLRAFKARLAGLLATPLGRGPAAK